ncbi:MAG: hypothetical protein ABR564_04665 [Candidatus Dormibacteria bacterium]
MSLFRRLLGSPVPDRAPNTVVIPEDVASRLRAPGVPLEATVEGVLRAYLQGRSSVSGSEDPAAMPFWVERGRTGQVPGRDDLPERGDIGDIEDELRHRVIERHAGEGPS